LGIGCDAAEQRGGGDAGKQRAVTVLILSRIHQISP
jgi:hypothetical protein